MMAGAPFSFFAQRLDEKVVSTEPHRDHLEGRTAPRDDLRASPVLGRFPDV